MMAVRCAAFAVALGLTLGVAAAGGPPVVLVTGATGRTGLELYKQLKANGVSTRAFVRNATKAREVLGCTLCDVSEGIYIGDITDPGAVQEAAKGATALAIATSAKPHCTSFTPLPSNCTYPSGQYPVDVDFKGAIAQVRAFATANPGSARHVVLCSASGTTEPDTFLDKMGHGSILFYKLNFEAFLASSGMPSTIVKPCGLLNTPAGTNELVVGHEDAVTVNPPAMSRADVARVMLEAILQPELSKGLRFDLCSKEGPPTTDFRRLLIMAKYPWESAAAAAIAQLNV